MKFSLIKFFNILILIALVISPLLLLSSKVEAAYQVCPNATPSYTLEGSDCVRYTSADFGSGTDSQPRNLFMTADNTLYISNTDDRNITKILPDGTTTQVNSIGSTGYSIKGLYVDSSDNIYTADFGSNKVSITDSSGNTSDYAAVGTQPSSIILASNGDFYVADTGDSTVTKINHDDQTTTTLSGIGASPISIVEDNYTNLYTANYDDGTVSKIDLSGDVVTPTYVTVGSNPNTIGFAPNGNLYVVNEGDQNLSEVSTTTGVPVNTIGSLGNTPNGIVFDNDGYAYVANRGDSTVSKIKLDDGTSRIIGTTGNQPFDISIDSDGNLYTADLGDNKVTKLTKETVASTSVPCPDSSYVHSGNICYKYASSTLATATNSTGIMAIDSLNNIYFGNYIDNTIRKITPSGTETILATLSSYAGQIFIDSSNNLYTNTADGFINKITPSGVVTQLGDGSIDINTTSGLVVDSLGNAYTSAVLDSKVYKSTTAGVTTIYQNTAAFPGGLVIDSLNNIYLLSVGANKVQKIPAGGASILDYGSTVSGPQAIHFDTLGNLFIFSSSGNIIKITPNGVSTTIVGSQGSSLTIATLDNLNKVFTVGYSEQKLYSYDSSYTPASVADIDNNPASIITDSTGHVFILSLSTNNIKKYTYTEVFDDNYTPTPTPSPTPTSTPVPTTIVASTTSAIDPTQTVTPTVSPVSTLAPTGSDVMPRIYIATLIMIVISGAAYLRFVENKKIALAIKKKRRIFY